jgi:hypothetical protein
MSALKYTNEQKMYSGGMKMSFMSNQIVSNKSVILRRG